MRINPLNAVVAVARNGVIGRGNALPWKLRSDLQRFKRLTMGHTLLMGRKTFESIGRPLPGRKTIVLSKNKDTVIEGAIVVPSIDAALELLPIGSLAFVVGGAEIYRSAMPLVDNLYLTRVLADIDGDAFFRDWPESEFECVEHLYTPANAFNDWPSEFFHLVRKTPNDARNV